MSVRGSSFVQDVLPASRDHRSFAFLEHHSLFNHFTSSQTVNPFKLTSQGGLKAEDPHDFIRDLRQIPESPIYHAQSKKVESGTNQKMIQYYDHNATHNPLQQDHFKYRHEAFDNRLQFRTPRIALSTNRNNKRYFLVCLPWCQRMTVISSKNFESTLHDARPISRLFVSAPNALPNSSEDVFLCENEARDGPSTKAPREDPMIGKFNMMDDAEPSLHPQLSTNDTTNITESAKLPVIPNEMVKTERRKLGAADKHSNSPEVALPPQTPPNPRRFLRSTDRYRASLMYNGAEAEDSLATPKISLPQPPSSALRSTLRPVRPSHRLGNYFKQPQYGFEPNSDPFDVEDNSFAI